MIKHKLKKIAKYAMPHGAVLLYSRNKNNIATNYCPICEQENVFLPMLSAGVRPRPRAGCPNCGSLERHRLTWLFINKKIGIDNLNKKQSMLHIAPEASLKIKLSETLGKKYLTADMHEKSVDVKMDITDIKYPSETFDMIMCNHVLEHVSDDMKAMKELFRVLKTGGWAILLAPIADMSKTYEDKKITSQKGRLKAFGQDDHVRKYGKDYGDRLKKAGFKLEVCRAEDLATRQEIKRMALKEDSKLWGFRSTDIYYCTK